LNDINTDNHDLKLAYMRLRSNMFTLDSNVVRFLGMGDDVEDGWYPPNVSLGHPLN
jgi:hypothetical protein